MEKVEKEGFPLKLFKHAERGGRSKHSKFISRSRLNMSPIEYIHSSRTKSMTTASFGETTPWPSAVEER